jgi:hypothetical protein
VGGGGVSHTGIPQLVEIPAPVTKMIFLERATESAIDCSCRESDGVTVSIGIMIV